MFPPQPSFIICGFPDHEILFVLALCIPTEVLKSISANMGHVFNIPYEISELLVCVMLSKQDKKYTASIVIYEI